MGKTDTINDRRVDVYLDSVDQKVRWAEHADEAQLSLSKFVQECVEYTLDQGGPDFISAGDQAEQLQELEDDITKLEQRIEEKDVLIEKLRTEIKEYRSEPFRDEDFEGTRSFDEDIVTLLKESGGEVRSEHLLRRLNVDPSNSNVIEGVQNQLEQLQSYGLVTETVNGWKWVGE